MLEFGQDKLIGPLTKLPLLLPVSMTPSITVLDEVLIISEGSNTVFLAINSVKDEYDNENLMIADFYTELFKMDEDFSVLKEMLNDIDLDIERLLKASLWTK